MATRTDTRLARLLQLASPALPVGAFSYSQALEAAVEAGVVTDAASARTWIEDALEFSLVRMEAPVLARMVTACAAGDAAALAHWNEGFLASRESAELRAETLQMGYSLARLLPELGVPVATEGLAFPAVFAHAVAAWDIAIEDALIAYLWSWAENQVMAALKAVPLGQTDGQRMLLALGDRVEAAASEALALPDDELGNYAPGLALLSARHETQYTRLFRS
jgi:urease accessory protein